MAFLRQSCQEGTGGSKPQRVRKATTIHTLILQGLKRLSSVGQQVISQCIDFNIKFQKFSWAMTAGLPFWVWCWSPDPPYNSHSETAGFTSNKNVQMLHFKNTLGARPHSGYGLQHPFPDPTWHRFHFGTLGFTLGHCYLFLISC